ncbi:MAG: PGPGW domain-containing protein [Granulosicoccus sp.]
MMQSVVPWLMENRHILTLIGALSLLLLTVTILATPWLVARLPADYFRRYRTPVSQRGLLRVMLALLRNLGGVTLMILGIIMLVTPGPGLVAFLAGLSVCEFRGKYRLLRKLAAQPRIFATLNYLRHRKSQPPFLPPRTD